MNTDTTVNIGLLDRDIQPEPGQKWPRVTWP
jgi:hypothetical protein